MHVDWNAGFGFFLTVMVVLPMTSLMVYAWFCTAATEPEPMDKTRFDFYRRVKNGDDTIVTTFSVWVETSKPHITRHVLAKQHRGFAVCVCDPAIDTPHPKTGLNRTFEDVD